MMSTYADQKVINEAMKLGADEYIEKSCFLREITGILNKIVWKGM